MSGLADLAKRLGIAAQVVGHPTCFDIFFTDTPIVDYRATLTNDVARLRRFNDACLRRGVVKGPTKIYVSCAHTEDLAPDVLDVAVDGAGGVDALVAVHRVHGLVSGRSLTEAESS